MTGTGLKKNDLIILKLRRYFKEDITLCIGEDNFHFETENPNMSSIIDFYIKCMFYVISQNVESINDLINGCFLDGSLGLLQNGKNTGHQYRWSRRIKNQSLYSYHHLQHGLFHSGGHVRVPSH